MNRDLRTVLAYAAQGPTAVQEAAKRLARKRPAPEKRIQAVAAASERKRQRREERTARVAELRRMVMDRAWGRCEIRPCGATATEMHHILSGPDRRRQESVTTCVALCEFHHHLAHRNDPDLLAALIEWADQRGWYVAKHALQKRLAKAAEARGARMRGER